MDRVSPAMIVKSEPEIARVEPPLSVYLSRTLADEVASQDIEIDSRIEAVLLVSS